MRIFLSLLLAASTFLAVFSPTIARENHAILIGASTYPNLDKKYWLKGPANDIDLVATYLTNHSAVPFSAENITILADGIKGKQAPTLAAIRAAFAALADTVKPGDFVYLHFSGHGSQAPAADPDSELDGLDELFLPVDIGPWDDQSGTVKNALVDDEIGQMIDALRAKGATVWAVFDSCHSGTVTRAAPTGDDEVRLRKLDPGALGIPADMMDAAAETSRGLDGPRQRDDSPLKVGEQGGLIAFFAAQTNETTPEKRMPKGKKGRRSQGVFTFVLFETLSQNPGITYRQLGQEILRQYGVKNLARATPLFEGELDTVVFSGEAAEPVSQWPVEMSEDGVSIAAGSLHNLAEGSEMAIMASASDDISAAIGYYRIIGVETFTAYLDPIAANDKPAIQPADLPRGAYLRQIETAIDFTLTVALPEGQTVPARKLLEAVEILKSEPDFGQRIQFVAPGAPADIRLAVLPKSRRPHAIWMLPSIGILEESDGITTPSISTGDKNAEELAQTLSENFTHMSRAFNLLKIGAGFGISDLDVTVSLRTKNKRNKKLRDLDTLKVPRLIPGDEVHILAQNNMDFPVDINVLYVGSDYSIAHFFAGRMQPGDSLKKGLLRITDQAYGRDRVVLVLTPAKPQSIVENLAFMAQDEITTTRGGGGSNIANLLSEAGFGTTTRGAMALDDDSDGPGPQILQFEIDAVPAN